MRVGKTNNSLPAAAWEYALEILTRRQRSEEEMRRKLQQKGFPEEIIAATLNRLQEAALLDDARFARDWAAYRLATRPLGRRRLLQELRQHGIPASLAEATVSNMLSSEAELTAARGIASRYRRHQGESNEHYFQRLARFLWQRGFAMETVRQVLAELARNNFVDSYDPNV